MNDWQPIETAPKDGTEILIWREDCGTMVGRYACAASFLSDQEQEKLDEESLWADDWWYAASVSGGRLEGREVPTHWMPLPQRDTPE